MDIVVEKVFTTLKISVSSGPDIAIFKRFRDKWSSIYQNNFDTITSTADNIPTTDKEDIRAFAVKQLEVHHPRDDYKELLELVVKFLGAIPRRGIRFVAPGALHRAR